MTRERPIAFRSARDWLYGVLHSPATPGRRGVLIIVGGPQYRVGSHRQFLLLARALADGGTPVLRFDYRGMGDSDGPALGFEDVGRDIGEAIDVFVRESPGLEEVVLWGLCDAASAALFYAAGDARVAGLVLLNPWVRTEQGLAGAYLRHYYLARLFDADLWRKAFRGELHYARALRSLGATLAARFGVRSRQEAGEGAKPKEGLPELMLRALQAFHGRVLLVLSGDDLTAGEFKDCVVRSRPWQRALAEARVTRRDLPGANHTFSRREWRDEVALWTAEWLRSW